MSTALIQEVRTAIGFKQQADLTTGLAAGDMVSLRQTNTDLIQSRPINEDDANDIGKGVYITETFPSNLDGGGPWNGRQTSQAMALVAMFGIGKTPSKATAGAGFKYTVHEPIFSTDGLEMPATSFLVQIRTSTDAITDKLLIGNCCEEWGFNYRQGAGRDNGTFSSTWLGTGSYTKPSGVTMPDIYAEASMNAGGLDTLSMDGFDYIANKRFVSVDFKWKNNIRDQSGYFPGSGQQGGYQLRGRMRRAQPVISMSTVVECDSGSSEEDLLLAQTPGTCVINCNGASLGGGAFHGFKIQLFKIVPRATPIGEADGIAVYNVDWVIEQHPSNGVLQIDATTDIDDILVSA